MAKGQKTEYEQLVLVMSDYFTTRSYMQTSRNLDMPESTVETLVKAHYEDEEFVKLREEKEKEFVKKANHLIFKSMNKMDKQLDTEEPIPINQLTTAIGTLFDKKIMLENGISANETPSININIVDNSNLEKVMYDNDKSNNKS